MRLARRTEQRVDARTVAMAGVMLAFVFVMTRVPSIPIGPSGYVHLGDAAIYAAAFLLGPVVGLFAAAFGTMFADLSAGYGSYAPGTFVIHGLQGLAAALIGWRRGTPRMVAATVVGGAIVVVGYFLYQWAILRQGLGVAAEGLWPNTFQVVVGAAIGIPLAIAVLRAYPPVATFGRRPTWQEEPEGLVGR